MKVLSKYFKVALCFMAFALCSFMFAFTPTYTAVQAAEMAIENYKVAINALKMPTTEVNYENGDKFRIPLLSETINANYKIRVITPSGYYHDYNVNGTNEDTFFGSIYTATANDSELIEGNKYLTVNAKNDGDYKVVYISTVDTKTYYSNAYTVSVTNVSYELDFSTPVLDASNNVVGYTKNSMPSKLAESTEKFYLPVAYAKITDNEFDINKDTGAINNETASIKVTKDGAPQEINKEGSIFGQDAEGYYIVPSAEGVYTIEYSYEDSANRPTKTFTINVEEGYEVGALSLASTPTMPTIELGQTITLPKITVNAGDEKNVDVDVKSIVIEKENSNGAIKCVLENNNFEFVMSPESFTGVDNFEDMVGNYRVTYNVQYLNEENTLTETFKVSGVTVSSKPTIKLSYNYDTSDADYAKKVVLGAETELHAEYAYHDDEGNKEFILPAVYVEDAVTTNFDDFIIIRAIRKGSTYYYVDNYKYDADAEETDYRSTDIDAKNKNASGDANIGDPTKAVKFKFADNATNVEGTYYLEYRVISKQVKERESYLYTEGTTTKYSFKVVDSTDLTKYEDPTVEITNLKDSSVKNSDIITVKASSTDKVDTRLKTAVFTYTGSTGVTENGLSTFEDYLAFVYDNLSKTVGVTNKTSHLFDDERLITGWTVNAGTPEAQEYKGLSAYYNNVTKIEENETKNNFDLNLTTYTSGTVNVVAAAINDDGKIGTDTKVLTIKDSTDEVAPTITIYSAGKWTGTTDPDANILDSFVVGQGETVTLPEVYIADYAHYNDGEGKYEGGDNTLSLNVMYYIDSPENAYGGISYLSPIGKSFGYKTVDGKEVQVLKGGSIVTSETGTYYVAYTATDVAGNTSVMYFTFEVKDTSKPILSVEPVADDVTISGNTITGTKGTIIDFETTLKSADGKTDYTTTGDLTITIEDDGKGLDYQPSGNSKTSYVFNSYGTYMVKIEGSYDGRDADAKVIKVVIEKKEIKWLGEFDVPSYATTKEDVYLPDVAASNGAVVKVTYVAPGDSSSEAKDATKVIKNGYTYWTFKTSDTKGSYTVTYTATTDEDVLTKTVNIKVGDNVAPTLSFNKGELTQDFVYEGEDIEYVLEVNKSKKTFVVKVINKGQEVISHDIGLVISDKDDMGTDSNMSWTNLTYELVGDNVTKGETSTVNKVEKTQYLISGTGKYTLKLTMSDNYDNERTAEIKFNVVAKSEAKENNDTVVGAVLIVISLILLAGVILFFTFTGKKGGTKTTKTKKVAKAPKTQVKENKAKEEAVVEEKVEETKEVEAEEIKTEEAVVEDNADEVVIEETQEEAKTEEEVSEEKEDEPKTGDVE